MRFKIYETIIIICDLNGNIRPCIYFATILNTPLIEEVDADALDLLETLMSAGLPAQDLGEPGRRFFRFRDGADS